MSGTRKGTGVEYAKLTRPRLHSPVARKRLFRRLDALRRHACVWVAGPPGSGKTTLAASWLETRSMPHRWYRIDATDRDPANLFMFLAELARTEDSGTEALPWFRPEYLADLRGFSRRFFQGFFRGMPENAVLVFDDAHDADRDILGVVLEEAIRQVPRGMSLLVLAREHLPAGLARAFANGDVVCLEPGELQLTGEETAEIAGTIDHALLHGLCGGWVAGLRLLLSRPRDDKTASFEPGTRSQELLFAYFAAEVFDCLPERVRALLTVASLLPEFAAGDARALAGEEDACEILDELYRTQHFLSRTPGKEPVYRLHDLYRGFLHSRFEASRDSAERKRCQERAAALCETAGHIHAAVALLAQAGAFHEARRVVLTHADAWTRTGRWQSVAGWLGLLPQTKEEDTWLLYWRAVCSQVPDPGAAKGMFAAAYARFGDADDRRGQFLCAVSVVECVLANMESLVQLDDWIDALEPHVASGMADYDVATQVRAWFGFLYAAMSRKPAHPRIRQGIEWLVTGLRCGDIASAPDSASAGVAVAMYCCLSADHRLGAQLDAMGELMDARGDTPPVTAWLWHLWLGSYYLWRLDYTKAKGAWERAFAISRATGLEILDLLPHAFMTLADLVEDRLDTVAWRLAEMRRLSLEGRPFAEALYHMTDLFYRFYRGDFLHVDPVIDAFLESAERCGSIVMQALACTDVAAVLLLLGQESRAAPLVSRAKALVGGTMIHAIDAQIPALEALLAFRQNRADLAGPRLEEALLLERNLGNCGCLLWIRAGFSALLADALEHGTRPDSVRDLIRRHQIPAPSRRALAWPWPIRVRALGPLAIDIDGAPWRPDRKTPRRLLEFLKALVAEGGRDVSSDLLADRLWPDSDGDVAQNNLRGTVKRLRDLLGHPEAIRLADGKVSFNERLCWLDVHALEEIATDGDIGVEAGADRLRHLGSQTLGLYRGQLMQGDSLPWLSAARRRARDRFVRAVGAIADALNALGDRHAALALCEAALEREPEAAALSQLTARWGGLAARDQERSSNAA